MERAFLHVPTKEPISSEQLQLLPIGKEIGEMTGSVVRRAATTRPELCCYLGHLGPSSSGARRGYVSDAKLDYLDYLASLDGRDTIHPSMHPLEW